MISCDPAIVIRPRHEHAGRPDRALFLSPRRVFTGSLPDICIYEFNRSAAQQLFRGEALQESRTIRFSVSPEDRLLQPVDEQRGFGGADTPLR